MTTKQLSRRYRSSNLVDDGVPVVIPPTCDRVASAANVRPRPRSGAAACRVSRPEALLRFSTISAMTTPSITTKTSEEIAAAFEAAFKNIEPLEKAERDVRWTPYREAVLTQRKRGLTWQQIAEVMGGPVINEPISARTLRRVFGGKKARTARAQKVGPV